MGDRDINLFRFYEYYITWVDEETRERQEIWETASSMRDLRSNKFRKKDFGQADV